MSPHTSPSRSTKPTIHSYNIDNEHEAILQLIEAAEYPNSLIQPKDYEYCYGTYEKWEMFGIILLLITTRIILAIIGWIIATISNYLMDWIYLIFDFFLVWGNIVLIYMMNWNQGLASWNWFR